MKLPSVERRVEPGPGEDDDGPVPQVEAIGTQTKPHERFEPQKFRREIRSRMYDTGDDDRCQQAGDQEPSSIEEGVEFM